MVRFFNPIWVISDIIEKLIIILKMLEKIVFQDFAELLFIE